MSTARRPGHMAVWAAVMIFCAARAVMAADLPVRTFDQDPAWEKFGKTAMGGFAKQVTQDFGWRPTKKTPAWAGKFTGQFSWAFADVANRNWKASGVGAFDGGVYQKTMSPPIKSDGKPHDFAVAYDPAGGEGGAGEVSVTIDGKTWKE